MLYARSIYKHHSLDASFYVQRSWCEDGCGCRCATLVNTSSGWCFIAHGTYLYQDGSIEWDWSNDGYYMSALTLKLLLEEV